MSSILVPISTVTAGTFTPTGAATLWQATNETVPLANDATYIGAQSPSACALGLSAIGDPGHDTGVSMRVRARRTGVVTQSLEVGVSNEPWLTLTLLEGFIPRHIVTQQLLAGSTFATYQFGVPASATALIADWDSLSIELSGSSSPGNAGNNDGVRVSAFDMPIVDVAGYGDNACQPGIGLCTASLGSVAGSSATQASAPRSDAEQGSSAQAHAAQRSFARTEAVQGNGS